MEKNKKITRLTLGWQSPKFLKTLFLTLFFLIVFVSSLFLVVRVYQDKKATQQAFIPPVSPPPASEATPIVPASPLATSEAPPVAPAASPAAPPPVPEAAPVAAAPPLEIPPIQVENKALEAENKVIALALLNATLEKLIPPEALKTFLQKIPEPWAQTLLVKVAPPIDDFKNYPQLEELLLASIPLKSCKKLIHIRKLNHNGEYEKIEVGDIRRALHEHDLEKTLKYYESLAPHEKMVLTNWNDYAQRLKVLQDEMKRFSSEITGGLK